MADATGGALRFKKDATPKQRRETLRELVHIADTASREAWAVLGESMQAKPHLLRQHAPQAHALMEAVWNADSDLDVGRLLAGQAGSVLSGEQPGGVWAKRSDAWRKGSPNSPRAATASQQAQVTRVNGWVAEALQLGRDARSAAVRKVALLTDLVAVARKSLPSSQRYLDLVRRAQADRIKSERSIDSILDDFTRLTADERGTGPRSVNAFLEASTVAKAWGYKPEHLPNAKVDPAMQVRFAMLSPGAQAVVKRVFQHGHDSIQALREQALAAVAHESDVLIADARRRGDAAGVKKLENAKLRSSQQFAALAEK